MPCHGLEFWLACQSRRLVPFKALVSWLDQVQKDAQDLFLMGDLFDFWFEYKYVVPKGFVRILGKLAEISDMGIPVHFFVGNHDMWMKDYFQKELNIQVYFEPFAFNLNGKDLLIGHGDGLGPGDHGYKTIKKIFRNPNAQALFGCIPPFFGIGLANFFSRKSRAKTGKSDEVFESEEKEIQKEIKLKVILPNSVCYLVISRLMHFI